MKKVFLFVFILMCMLFCSCGSETNEMEVETEEQINNIDLDSIYLGKTTLYELEQLLGDPSEIMEPSLYFSYYWAYEDQYFANIPCTVKFYPNGKTGQSVIEEISIVLHGRYSNEDNFDELIASMQAYLSDKYWASESKRINISDSIWYNVERWNAKDNAGEKRFKYIYYGVSNMDTHSLTFTNEKEYKKQDF